MNSAGGGSFGENPDDPEGCEGRYDVGGQNSGGGGDSRRGYSTFSFQSEGDGAPGLRYKHPLEWRANWDVLAREVRIIRPTGSVITFIAPPGSAEAVPSGASRKVDYRVQLLSKEKKPCKEYESPVYIDMVESNGRVLRFSVSTGRVVALISSMGVETSAEDYDQQLKVERNPLSGEIRSIWSKSQGLLYATYSYRALVLSWYAPDQIEKRSGKWIPIGEPWKRVSYEWDESGIVMNIAEERMGMGVVFRTRRELGGGNKIRIVQGEGDDRTVKIIQSQQTGNNLETIITHGKPGDDGNIISSCVRSVKRWTAGGWLTISRTEGYGSTEAQTTLYTYNNEFRVSLKIKPDGGYTRYEYDEKGRVILEAEPWVGGGEKGKRTTYANLRFYDNRPSIEEELFMDENGNNFVCQETVYTYEETPECLRTRIVEKFTGSGLPDQTRIEEVYGSEAPYRYSRGRGKYTKGIDGVETAYSYEATGEYGACHLVTMSTQINGALVLGKSRRTCRYIAENGTTTRQEEYVYLENGWELISAEDYAYDIELNKTKTTRANGRVSTTSWMCCGPLREVDEDGVVTSYGYSTSRQLIETIRSATETTPETITSYVRDGNGRILVKRVDTGALTTFEKTSYDAVGRVRSSTDTLGRETQTSYSLDLLTTVIKTPSQALLINRRHYDGTIVEQSGDGQRPLEISYYQCAYGMEKNVSSGGIGLSYAVYSGSGVELALYTPHSISKYNTYDSAGRLIETQIEGLAPTTTQYDDFGQPKRQTIVLDKNDPNNPAKNRIIDWETRYEQKDDGIYQVKITTNYNAQGQPLSQSEATLVSSLNPLIAGKTIITDVYGKQSITWTEHTSPGKRTSFSQIPTSNLIAQTSIVDGFAISQTDHHGVTTTQTRAWTSSGMTLRQTDSRGNTTVTQTDKAGRPISVTDAAGSTTTQYNPYFDLPSCITNAQGGTICYAYDIRGRKTAEWGTAIQPASYVYDQADRLISLTTYRVSEGEITTDPTGRTDGDTTRWTYDEATGLELKKTYADGRKTSKTYDRFNTLASITQARGVMTTYTHAPLTQELVSVTHSDGTPGWSFEYNHLGQLTSITDASGTHAIAYDSYGRKQSETRALNGITYVLAEKADSFGRELGYALTKNATSLEDISYTYGIDGRMAKSTFIHAGTTQSFSYGYLGGTNLLSTIAHPNGITVTRTYEQHRNLITTLNATRGSTGVTLRTYTYDSLSRPATLTYARQGKTRTDTFAYNSRSELTGATLGASAFGYEYDNIGNRKTAQQLAEETNYQANTLNQYTSIAKKGTPSPFQPQYDADGNQTLIQTATGIWNVTYDANNRPVKFTSQGGTTTIDCGYDYMGRRFEKKVTVNGTITLHHRYLYRGYLQIVSLDAKRANMQDLWLIHWDPTQPTATRPLSIRKNGTWYTYGHDLTKNVTEVFNTSGAIATTYDYTPFGAVTTQGTFEQPLQWSSEVYDEELALTYYNYRHYNPMDGRWINRDPIAERGGYNLYGFVGNGVIWKSDYLGQDRYITNFSDPETGAIKNYHVGVAVDNWIVKNGKYVRNGITTYDFVAKLTEKEGFLYDLLNLYNIFITPMVARGSIISSHGLTLKDPMKMKSNPCQDMMMVSKISQDKVNIPVYNLMFHNCVIWASKAFLYGLDDESTQKCCNPDHTEFEDNE